MNVRRTFLLRRSLPGFSAWLFAGLVALGATLRDAEAVETTNASRQAFIRYEPGDASTGQVRTAVKTYGRDDGVQVTLLAAVHVGDRAYFEKLQKRFERCDALLYEMIRDQDTSPGEKISTDHPVSQLQLGLKSLLELEFQLDAIDYTKPNFVHADLDPDTFFRLQEERRESILGLMFRAALEEESRQRDNPQSVLSPFQLLFALMSSDRAHALKLVLGRQMAQLESVVAGIDQGPDGKGSVLVSARDERVIKVLQEQIGRGRKQLGIFYGAGHMPDLESRLGRLGFRKVSEEWLTAWDIKPKLKPAEQ